MNDSGQLNVMKIKEIWKKQSRQEKHSSRMCTDRLPTVCVSVATRCQHWLEESSQVNKFEQVSNLSYQISLAWEGCPQAIRFECVSNLGHKISLVGTGGRSTVGSHWDWGWIGVHEQ